VHPAFRERSDTAGRFIIPKSIVVIVVVAVVVVVLLSK